MGAQHLAIVPFRISCPYHTIRTFNYLFYYNYDCPKLTSSMTDDTHTSYLPRYYYTRKEDQGEGGRGEFVRTDYYTAAHTFRQCSSFVS